MFSTTIFASPLAFLNPTLTPTKSSGIGGSIKKFDQKTEKGVFGVGKSQRRKCQGPAQSQVTRQAICILASRRKGYVVKLILRIVLVKGVPLELSERVAFLDEITFEF